MAIVVDGVLSSAVLLEAAGESSYERGMNYVDAVRALSVSAGRATGKVKGTLPYDVQLTWDDGVLSGACTCPHFLNGNFCKHLVAVGLAVLDGARTSALDMEPHPTDPVERYLEGLEAAELRELVLLLAQTYPAAEEHLETMAALATGDTQAVQEKMMATARSLTSGRRFLDYYEAMDYANQVEDFLDELAELLGRPGGASAASPALLHITTRLRTQLETRVDDSSGMVGDACQRAVELYARACRASDPDPVKLGRWLAAFRIDSPGWPETTLSEFLPALGDRGLAVYRRAVEKAARRSTPDDDAYPRSMLIELADHDGDLDRAVQLLGQGEHPQYPVIIERLLAVGRRREAISYLDRAVAESRVSSRSLAWGPSGNPYWLDPYRAVELYLEDGQTEDALELVRGLFRSEPSPQALDLVISTGERLGRRDEELEDALTTAENRDWPNGDTVIALALHIGDVKRAWAAADRWGVRASWQELADAEPQPRPDEAIELYRKNIEKTLITPGRANAREAADMALLMRRLIDRADDADQGSNRGQGHRAEAFAEWLEELKSRYRRRPTVDDEFTRAGL
ncbi:SWIM zinc finger family protein [Propionibacterium australiense]|nr:DUF6880 family protein [Propionibacterium australiense]SYZ33022.1 Zinc finger SWIM-type profile [Propionibacterium australiense]VEH92225.1 Uncharacterized conserved protein [Propionibacterium australiense]